MSLIKSRFVFVLIMLMILFVLSVLIWLRYDSSVKQFEALQLTLMEQQAEQAAKSIDEIVSHIRHQMSAISLDGLWLHDINLFSKDITVQESLANKFRLYFPKMHSYVITNAHGEQIGGDYDFFIEKVCQQDIEHVASMFHPEVDYFEYEPYIHPKAEAYHFDVMMPVYVKNREMIFFMSFSAELLRKTLSEHMISSHEMYLVRRDVPDLIEVSSEAVRDKLTRPFQLSQTELSKIKVAVDVPHTKWQVVVVENESVLEEYQRAHLMEMIGIFVVLALFWTSVLWLGLQHEMSRGRLLSKLNYISHHDDLTGLANRRKLLSEIKYAIDDARYRGSLSALIFLDLNDFKEINDCHGHEVGDAVLIACAKRLSELTRSGDLVARLGGDEFVVLLSDLSSSPDKAQKVVTETVRRFRQNLCQGYMVSQVHARCQPSIGVQLITKEDMDAVKLLKKADKKMYEDKQRIKKSSDADETASESQK